MDRAKFFAALRLSLFKGGLSQPQVDGINALLESARSNGVRDRHHVANILAQVHRETGGYMLGIKETVYASHKDKNPSDATVIARLEKAWKAGKLKGVKTPYWRDGAFGRGPIQLTHWTNYEKFGRRLGVPLRQNPALALDPRIGADIAVVGMKEGMFRSDGRGGLSLGRYSFPRDLDNPPATNPRRIVNGNDGSDKVVAAAHRAFFDALTAGGYGTVPTPPPEPRQPDDPGVESQAPAPEPISHSKRFWTWLTTGGGTAALPFVDWRVQFLIVLVVVGFAIYAIATMPAVRRKLGLT